MSSYLSTHRFSLLSYHLHLRNNHIPLHFLRVLLAGGGAQADAGRAGAADDHRDVGAGGAGQHQQAGQGRAEGGGVARLVIRNRILQFPLSLLMLLLCYNTTLSEQ